MRGVQSPEFRPSTAGLIMIGGLVEVFVVQDRVTGDFFDINMSPVKSLRHAARADSVYICNESMANAVLSGDLDLEDGYDVHSFYEVVSDF